MVVEREDVVRICTGGVSANPEMRGQLAALLPEMRGFARFLVRNREQADDLVQDAVLRALTAAAQFTPGTNLRAWVFTIVRNVFHETTRRRRVELRIIGESLQKTESIGPEAEARGDIGDLEKALWQLSPDLREALILVGAHELDYEEAAIICNVPVGTMKARVSRARTKLARIAAASA